MTRLHPRRRRLLTALMLPVLLNTASMADAAGPVPGQELFDLSLEELMNVVVTSVGKKAQPLGDTAAAVFVISANDIRRSGASNIPEALRLAPGVHVAQFANNRWSVSIRGFGGRFSNKLLVLQDGRSIYTPMYSGVFWESIDVPLENIERIEVIRGPGASIWGANAVNGVINIITRSARDSQGTRVAVGAGSELRGTAFASTGVEIDATTHLRIHAEQQYVEPSVTVGGDAARDFLRTQRAGLRLDRDAGADRYSVDFGVINSDAGDQIVQASAGDPPLLDFTSRANAAHLLGLWERLDTDGTRHSLQGYVEHEKLSIGIGNWRRSTFDLEYQQQLGTTSGHDIVWGTGIRHTRDDVRGVAPYVSLTTERRNTNLVSVFVQDDITLQPNRWKLTVGSRLEHNAYSGYEFQPNVRLLHMPDEANRLWLSVARASRTPSRGESDARTRLRATRIAPPGGPGPEFIVPYARGNADYGAEQLDAIDAGWRTRWSPTLSTDLAVFRYRYDDLRGGVGGMPFFDFARGELIQPIEIANLGAADSQGAEASADWRVAPDWHLQASYSWYKISLRNTAGPTEYSESSPTHLVSLRSSWDISADLQLDVWLRHVSQTSIPLGTAAVNIPSYYGLDMRLAWKPRKDFELALIGQNLLDSRHPEAVTEQLASAFTEVQRGAYVKATWQF